MSATLKNKSRQPVVLVLDHPAFATKANGWNRTTASFGTQTEDGRRVIKEVRRAYPGTITIMPGQEATGLHDAIASCAQVPELISRGVLAVSYQSDEQPPPQPKARSKPKDEPAPVSRLGRTDP